MAEDDQAPDKGGSSLSGLEHAPVGKQSEACLESILNAASGTPVIATDRRFAIVYFNPAAQALFGHRQPLVNGTPLHAFEAIGLHRKEALPGAVKALELDGVHRFRVELAVEESVRLVEMEFSVMHNRQGEPDGYILSGQDITRLHQQQERLTRKAAEEQCLGVLLRLSLGKLGTETFLQKSLETLLHSIPWLNLLPRGAVFLVDNQGDDRVLRLTASHSLAPEISQSCTRVSFGYCICGRAAAKGEILFVADSSDVRHDIRYPGMEPHGHYAVPILQNGRVNGIMTLYLPPGHREKESDKAFLKRVADVLSMGIARRQAERELAYQAQHDNLTGLPNREQLMYHLERALARARRHNHVGAVMFIDLDHFKNINDSLGHSVGDRVLREVAQRLMTVLRREDTVARLGGDEFIVLISEEGGSPRAVARQSQRVAEKIRDSLSRTYRVDAYSLNITPSIGVALFPDKGQTTSEVLQQADTAMYRAKAEGRNCIRFFLPVMQMLANERLAVEQDLRWALDQDKLQLHYQPQVNGSGTLVGAEALLRCPGQGGEFNRVDLCIEVAETTGLIIPIGEWVLREACRQLVAWQQDGAAGNLHHLCVNISPRQFLQRDFVSLVQRVVSETGVDPQLLVLEITEGTLIDAKRDAIETMKALKGLGIRIAIDDFGTGYSSLAYLTRLPLDILKIDRSFVSGVNGSPKSAAVAEALMVMARQLQLNLVAEGVETRDELEFLLARECDCFQGFYFSRPQPAERFRELIRHGFG
ncbi:MAG: EAL domain-containing protein [Sedimenticola sp.]|nr:EAL domain-containing protein [Sedimenticola sp.]